MLIREDDELATYVVASSAYRVLRDLREQRGGNHFKEALQMGLFYMARDLIRGALPPEAYDQQELILMVKCIATLMRSGQIETFNDIEVRVSAESERHHWQSINRPYNFLKNADRDVDQLLALETVKPEIPILGASAIYKQLTGKLTDTMREFAHSQTHA